jgi:hypothetical protein
MVVFSETNDGSHATYTIYSADTASQRTSHEQKCSTSHVGVLQVSLSFEHVSSRHATNGMSPFAVGPFQTLRNQLAVFTVQAVALCNCGTHCGKR